MAKKQRVNVRVKQKKSLWQIIKTIIVIVLILGILSVMRSCSDPKMSIDLPDGKLGNFLEKLADFLPGGFIGLRKPGDSGDVEPGDSGDTTPELPPGEEDGKEDVGNGGEDDGGNEPSKKHSCDAEILTIYEQSATCISTGIAKHYECSECHLLFDAEGKEVTIDELTLPIDDNAHSSTSTLLSNEDGTHQCLCTYDSSHVKEVEECDYTEELVYDGSEHFRICGCGHKIDREDHYDDDKDSYCDACGVKMTSGDGDNGGSGGDNEGENSGGSGGQKPDNPEEPDEPECEHRDADDDNLCDECGEEFSDGTECQHLDVNDDGFCDKCGVEYQDWCHRTECKDADHGGKCDVCGYDMNYNNKPGSSEDNKQFAVLIEDFDSNKVGGNVEILYKFEVWETEVDIGVLYWNNEFYGTDVTLKLEDIFKVIPTDIETNFALYKIRVKFSNESYFNEYASLICSEGSHHIILNEEDLSVEIRFSDNDSVNLSYQSTVLCLSNGQKLPKEAIASIVVDTILEVSKYD